MSPIMEISRRDFFKWLMVTGTAVAVAGCGVPPHQALVSQLDLPEYRLPGEARWFATTCQECAGGCGVSVRVIDGRAKKIEGIPEHPINHGKVCARGQSSLQALYHPERLTSPLKRQGEGFAPSADWKEALAALASQLQAASGRKGSMLWITPTLHGTAGSLLAWAASRAGARIWVLDFPGSIPQRSAMKGLTGKAGLPYYPLSQADYVVSFGSDFFLHGNLPVHQAWGYGEFRQGRGRDYRGILVAFSPRLNLTTASADRWMACRPGTEGWVALGLGNLISKARKGSWPAWASKLSLEKISQISGVPVDVFKRLAARLLKARRPLAVAGADNGMYANGSWSIAMIQMLNQLLGGKVDSFEPDWLVPLPGQEKPPGGVLISARQALEGLEKRRFETAWVLEANPRHLLPAKLNFEKLFSGAKNKVVFSPFHNETTLLADWVLPTQTWLESWGDRLLRGPFGAKSASVYNLQQPVVQGRSGSMSVSDIVLAALGEAKMPVPGKGKSLHDLLKASHVQASQWENLLVRGGSWEAFTLDWEPYQGSRTHPLYPPPVVSKKSTPPGGVSPWEHVKPFRVEGAAEPKFAGEGQVLLPFYSAALADGSLANRPWMQELPDPLTTVTWTHWVELSTEKSKSLGVERGDLVRLVSEGGSLVGPALPSPGLHPEAVAVPVGQGHTHYGEFANRGENPLRLLSPVWQEETGELAWTATRVRVEKTGSKAKMTTMDERVNHLPVEFMPL